MGLRERRVRAEAGCNAKDLSAMTRRSPAAWIALAVSAAPLAPCARSATAHGAPAHGTSVLQVRQPWSRPTVAGANAVGYMTVANHGRAADALVRVESPLAVRVEIHASSMSGGVMSMRKQDRVVVPAGGQASFAPGGYHLMLVDVTRTLVAGDVIPATLSFASGARIKALFKVSSGAAELPISGMDHMHH